MPIYTFRDVGINVRAHAIDIEAKDCSAAYRKLQRLTLDEVVALSEANDGYVEFSDLTIDAEEASGGGDMGREYMDLAGNGKWRRVG
jgi:hypothetical protein